MSSVVCYLTPSDGAEDDPAFQGKIRVTNDGNISVFDAMAAVGISQPRVYLLNLQKAHSEVVNIINYLKFPGPGQRDTPVTNRQGLAKILMLLPGKIAAKFRDRVSVLLERYLNADRALAADILSRADAKDAAAGVLDVKDHPRVKSCETTKSHMAAIAAVTPKEEMGKTCAIVNNCVNRAVTGMNTGQYRAHHGLKRGEGTRDYFLPPMSMGVTFMNSLHEASVRNGADPVRSIQRMETGFVSFVSEWNLHEMARRPVEKKQIAENRDAMEANRAHNRSVAGAPGAKRLKA